MADDNLTARVLESAVPPVQTVAEAMDRLAQNLKETTEMVLQAFEGFRRYVALYGPAEVRKHFARQPGVNFARYEHGRLRHYKRLGDGTVVRV